MSPDRVTTTLRFFGSWPWWAGAGAALALGGIVWLLYRREVRAVPRWSQLLLPALRAAAVMMIAVLLSGPVLHHQRVIGEFSRILLIVDNSLSMGIVDPGVFTSRAQRVQAALSERGLAPLSASHEVQILALEGGLVKRIAAPFPQPAGTSTDLTAALRHAFAEGDRSGAVVLFSDGQQNVGDPPLTLASQLAARHWPVFTVGFGRTIPPPDLAVVKMEAPESVFIADRLRGQVTLADHWPAGQHFQLTIRDGEKTLWEQSLQTEGGGLRTIPCEFPVDASVRERLRTRRGGTEVSNVPLEFTASVSHLPGDAEPRNDQAVCRVRAVTQKRRILLVDGRPRWEARYLRNLFERDDRWELRVAIGGTAGEERPAGLPHSAAELNSFDLVLFGDVPRRWWRPEELSWVHDFVAQRAGAIVFIDGPRGALREYADSPLGELLPVEWKAPARREGIASLRLPAAQQPPGPFQLVAESAPNADLWRTLPPPHWLSGATALPGSATLVETEIRGAPQPLPAIVLRPFGAGRVLYHAFEDSWRWRYEVADRYHVKYWMEIAEWMAEPPFALRDKMVALDAGAITYRPGESASLRVRLNDGAGHPVTNAVVDAVLYREGNRVASMRLEADGNGGGLFRGRTAPLEPGQYEVGVASAALAPDDLRARTSFKVEPPQSGELVALNLNEELLRQIATASGGQYLREDEIGRLPELLAALRRGRVIESDTVLAASYAWFVPIVLLLTVEWVLRKRVGLV